MRVEGTGFLGRNCCYAALAGCGVSARLAGGTLKTQKDSKQGEWQSAIEPCCGQFSLNPNLWDFDGYEKTRSRLRFSRKSTISRLWPCYSSPKGIRKYLGTRPNFPAQAGIPSRRIGGFESRTKLLFGPLETEGHSHSRCRCSPPFPSTALLPRFVPTSTKFKMSSMLCSTSPPRVKKSNPSFAALSFARQGNRFWN